VSQRRPAPQNATASKFPPSYYLDQIIHHCDAIAKQIKKVCAPIANQMLLPRISFPGRFALLGIASSARSTLFA